jgi:hypothetical protein
MRHPLVLQKGANMLKECALRMDAVHSLKPWYPYTCRTIPHHVPEDLSREEDTEVKDGGHSCTVRNSVILITRQSNYFRLEIFFFSFEPAFEL